MGGDDTMEFLYATDENFVHVLATSIYSLLKLHEYRMINIRVVLDQNVTQASRTLLKDIGKKFGKNISFIDMPDFDRLTNVSLDIKRYSMSMFSRLMADTLLPQSVERIIYLDADTLICDDLYPLWAADIGGKVIGAVNDFRSIAYCRNLGIRRENCYINSGVLLIDLKKYRSHHCEQRLLQALSRLNGMLEFPDNDLICKVLQDEIALIPMRFNMISAVKMSTYKQLRWMRHPAVNVPKEMYDISKCKPAIIHFTTFFMMHGRPWIAGCNHPDTQRYIQTRREATGLSPIKETTQKSIGKKLIDSMLRWMPKSLIIFFAGILHAYVKPWKQSIRMRKCAMDVQTQASNFDC